MKQNMGKVPGLQKKIFGKESNEFTNGLERKVILRVCPTEKKMVELFCKVLSGNNLASEASAKFVRQDVTFTDPTLHSVEFNILQDILEIWV